MIVNERWKLSVLPDCIMLTRATMKKETKELTFDGAKRHYYYPNFETALEGLIDRDFQDLESVEHIVGRIKELKDDIRSLLTKDQRRQGVIS